MAQAAIGRKMKIQVRRATRHQSGITVSGEIVSCEYMGYRYRTCTVVAQWRVVLTGSSMSYVVEQLPRF